MDALEIFFKRRLPNEAELKLCIYARYEARALKASLEKDEIKKLRCYLSPGLENYRNIYEMLSLDANSDRTLNLLSICAPLVYSVKRIGDLAQATETWKQQERLTAYSIKGIKESRYRLYYSALELVFMRATPVEVRAMIAYLVDDTKRLVSFNISEWVFKSPGNKKW